MEPSKEAKEKEKPSGKNIILCLDGTGNQFKEHLSNVVKLFRVLERDPQRQIAYYDPGVGTLPDPGLKTTIGKQVNKALGAGFGRGLTRNIEEAYSYLMERYEVGDRIFIYGFSRGAYTARALAAFIKECGLLEKGCQNLIPYATNLFKQRQPPATDKAGQQEFFKLRAMFRQTYARRFPKKNPKPGRNPWQYQCRIQFLGLWDTVKSYGWVRNPVIVRNEQGNNPSVLTVRHAIAVDEKRAFFRQMHWIPSPKQDVKEVWFPGVHSDVGGGYPEDQSGLAKISLEWMIAEARAKGLLINEEVYRLIVLGRSPAGDSKREEGKRERRSNYVGPDPLAMRHESLQGPWHLVQRLPSRREAWEQKGMRTIKDEEQRGVDSKDPRPVSVHQSVLDRMQGKPQYRPKNLLQPPYAADSLPANVAVEPWSTRTP